MTKADENFNGLGVDTKGVINMFNDMSLRAELGCFHVIDLYMHALRKRYAKMEFDHELTKMKKC